jgi:hypothetical protein
MAPNIKSIPNVNLSIFLLWSLTSIAGVCCTGLCYRFLHRRIQCCVVTQFTHFSEAKDISTYVIKQCFIEIRIVCLCGLCSFSVICLLGACVLPHWYIICWKAFQKICYISNADIASHLWSIKNDNLITKQHQLSCCTVYLR